MKDWERRVRALRLKRRIEADVGSPDVLRSMGFSPKKSSSGQYTFWIKEEPNFYKIVASTNPRGGVMVRILQGSITSGGYRKGFPTWQAAARWIRQEIAKIERDPKYKGEAVQEGERTAEIAVQWMAAYAGGDTMLGTLIGGAKSRASLRLEKRGNSFVVSIFGGAWPSNKVIAYGPTKQSAQRRADQWVKKNLS